VYSGELVLVEDVEPLPVVLPVELVVQDVVVDVLVDVEPLVDVWLVAVIVVCAEACAFMDSSIESLSSSNSILLLALLRFSLNSLISLVISLHHRASSNVSSMRSRRFHQFVRYLFNIFFLIFEKNQESEPVISLMVSCIIFSFNLCNSDESEVSILCFPDSLEGTGIICIIS